MLLTMLENVRQKRKYTPPSEQYMLNLNKLHKQSNTKCYTFSAYTTVNLLDSGKNDQMRTNAVATNLHSVLTGITNVNMQTDSSP